MDFLSNHLIQYIAIVVVAFTTSVAGMPSIIYISIKHKLFDNSDSYRKTHRIHISRLGGVSIFCSFTITILLFATTVNYQQANFLITSCIILFGLGLKDDLYGVSAVSKFILQLIVAIILVVLGGFKLTSLYGVFNVWEVNVFWGSLFSIVVIIFVNNSFNLLDGIDGLAGTIGGLAAMCFGVLFVLSDELAYAFIAFALFGAIAGFLVYNYYPAKIFMGDTGALIIGLVCVVLAIKFIEANKIGSIPTPYFLSAPAIAVSVLIIPIFDSLRVILIRLLSKKSPFKGDRNHIHHRLQKLGYHPNQIIIILCGINILMIMLSLLLQHWGNFTLITIVMLICVLVNVLITYQIGKKSNKSYKFSDVFFVDTLKSGDN